MLPQRKKGSGSLSAGAGRYGVVRAATPNPATVEAVRQRQAEVEQEELVRG